MRQVSKGWTVLWPEETLLEIAALVSLVLGAAPEPDALLVTFLVEAGEVWLLGVLDPDVPGEGLLMGVGGFVSYVTELDGEEVEVLGVLEMYCDVVAELVLEDIRGYFTTPEPALCNFDSRSWCRY